MVSAFPSSRQPDGVWLSKGIASQIYNTLSSSPIFPSPVKIDGEFVIFGMDRSCRAPVSVTSAFTLFSLPDQSLSAER